MSCQLCLVTRPFADKKVPGRTLSTPRRISDFAIMATRPFTCCSTKAFDLSLRLNKSMISDLPRMNSKKFWSYLAPLFFRALACLMISFFSLLELRAVEQMFAFDSPLKW